MSDVRSAGSWARAAAARGMLEGAALAAVLVGATLLLTYPLVGSLGSALPGNLGDPLLNAWTLGWGAQSLGGGRDVWDAPIFHPHEDTFAYSEHLLGITIFVAPVYWITGNAILTYNVAFLLSFVLAGGGMYLLIAALTGRKDVAIVIALAFAFSPLRMGAQVARLQMLMTGWLPLALWAIHRYAASTRRRYLVWFGVSTVLMVMSNMYMLLIGAVPIGLALLFELVRGRGRRAQLVRGFGVTLLFIGLQLAPVVAKYRAVQHTMGFSRDANEIIHYSATPTSYLAVFETMDWLPWVYRETTADRALYAGGTLLLLAVVGLVSWRRRTGDGRTVDEASGRATDGTDSGSANDRTAGGASPTSVLPVSVLLFYAALAAVAIGLSFGPVIRDWQGEPIGTGPYGWLQQIVPGLDGLRAPGRFGFVAAIGLSVLAAFGATRLVASAGAVRRGLVLGAATLLVVVEAWPVAFKVEPFDARGRAEDQRLYGWLGAQEPSALVELPASRHTARLFNPLLIYQFETLDHPHELVNGSSGFNSPLADVLEGVDSPFGDPTHVPDGVAMLRALGIRYVAVHTSDYADPDLAIAVVHSLRAAQGVAHHRQFGTNHVFELEARPEGPSLADFRLHRIPIGPHQLVASQGHEQTPHAVDSRLESGWSTGQPTGEDAWMQVRLAVYHDVRQIRLELGLAREWPRQLTVTSTGDDGKELQLYTGPVLPSLAKGLVEEPLSSPIVITLPPNRTRVLTLRAAADASPRVWSIHELELYGHPSASVGASGGGQE